MVPTRSRMYILLLIRGAVSSQQSAINKNCDCVLHSWMRHYDFIVARSTLTPHYLPPSVRHCAHSTTRTFISVWQIQRDSSWRKLSEYINELLPLLQKREDNSLLDQASIDNPQRCSLQSNPSRWLAITGCWAQRPLSKYHLYAWVLWTLAMHGRELWASVTRRRLLRSWTISKIREATSLILQTIIKTGKVKFGLEIGWQKETIETRWLLLPSKLAI